MKPLQVILGGGKTHLTKAEIEKRKEAESKFKPATDKIVCPSWLDGKGKVEWARIVKDLIAVDLMTNIDVTSLALYCDAYSKYRQASEAVRLEGTVIEFTNATGATNKVAHPGVSVMQKMAQQIRSFGAEFGLSPGARLRLVVPPETPKPKSALDEAGFGDV